MSNLQKLLNTIPQVGSIEWIGLRPAKKATLKSVAAAELNPEVGFIGDHYSGRSGKRQVTLIQAEHLEAVGNILGRARINPEEVRRNIVVRGINLLALQKQQISIGEDVILETTGLCHPCSRMEENLGPGGYNAMRGHGGITARVIRGGTISVGDNVTLRILETSEP